jgi:FAD synthase
MSIEIMFGAISDSLDKQLRKQGYKLKSVDLYQKDADAITRLLIRSLINESQAHAARKMLLRNMCAEIRKQQ